MELNYIIYGMLEDFSGITQGFKPNSYIILHLYWFETDLIKVLMCENYFNDNCNIIGEL